MIFRRHKAGDEHEEILFEKGTRVVVNMDISGFEYKFEGETLRIDETGVFMKVGDKHVLVPMHNIVSVEQDGSVTK